jgi:glycosyltransferase involved in cell wall biosynthesis
MMPACFWMRVAARRAGVPVRINKPASLWDYNTRVYRWIEWATAWMDSFVLASSLPLKTMYERFPGLRGRVHLSYYGMDMSVYDAPGNPEAQRASLGFAPDDFVVALIAYLIPPIRTVNPHIGLKGHEVLIESVASLHSTHPRLRLLIVGGEHGGPGAYTARLKELVVQRGIGDITVFTGHVMNPAPLFQAADVVVVPSLSENVGGPVPAFLTHRPVIASRVGGLPDVVLEGETGFLVPPANTTALAEAISRMARLTPSGREKMGRRGSVLCREKFDIQRVVGLEMNLCLEVLKSSRRGAQP